jgi:hypothetical protein
LASAARIIAAVKRLGWTCAVVAVEPRRCVTAKSFVSQASALPLPALAPA